MTSSETSRTNDHVKAESSGSARAEDALYTGARGIAVRILTRYDRSDSYVDKLLDHAMQTEDLGPKDRRLLTELVNGVLRHRERLDWVLTGFYHGEFGRCIPIVKNALRVALYQILMLDRIPESAAVNEAVELVKRLKGSRSAGMVNGVLRSVIRRKEVITWPDREADALHFLSVYQSHPAWLMRRWIDRFGEGDAERLARANNQRPTLSLRVNPLRSDTEQVIHEIDEVEGSADRSALTPGFLRVTKVGDPASLPPFQRGEVTPQDEGSGLAALLASPKPGDRVIDLCAAPGGKSMAMAEQMEARGTIIAVDLFQAKLPAIRTAAERLGFSDMIETVAADARHYSTDAADVLFLDAPCSGLGVLRRKPGIKWKREATDLPKLQKLQQEILRNAATMVKPGGALVYSTCTTEPEENQEVVERFLADHPEFELQSAEAFLPESAVRRGVVTAEGFLQTMPHLHGCDGMFAARMQRRETSA